MLFHEEDMIPQSREDFEGRKLDFVQEVKDSGIPRQWWAPIQEGAEEIRTDKGLDHYLVIMTKEFGR